MKLFLLCFLILFVILYIVAMLSVITSGKLFGTLTHKLLGWHLPDENISFDGVNQISHCKYCGKRILKCHMDWFSCDC